MNANDPAKTPITPPPPKRRSHSDSSGAQKQGKKQSQPNPNLLLSDSSQFYFYFPPNRQMKCFFQFWTKHDERSDSHWFYPSTILIFNNEIVGIRKWTWLVLEPYQPGARDCSRRASEIAHTLSTWHRERIHICAVGEIFTWKPDREFPKSLSYVCIWWRAFGEGMLSLDGLIWFC